MAALVRILIAGLIALTASLAVCSNHSVDAPVDAAADVGVLPAVSSTIVFVSRRDGNPEIYVMDADGANLANLTNHPEADTEPVWSPDGTRIAFLSRRDGEAASVYVMDEIGRAHV